MDRLTLSGGFFWNLEAQSLNEIGFIYTKLGEFKNGIDVVREALAIQADSPDLVISTYHAH